MLKSYPKGLKRKNNMEKTELDQRTQDRFNVILSKAIINLSSEDIAFLRARRMYLTEAEEEKYAEILSMEKVQAPEDDNSHTDELQKDLDKMNLDELREKAKEVGIILIDGKTKRELKELIANRQI